MGDGGVNIFLMGRHDWERSHYKTIPWAVPVDCRHCGSGRVFMEPPYRERIPTTWRCADCRGQFSVHKDRDYDPTFVSDVLRADSRTPEASFDNVIDMLDWLNRAQQQQHHDQPRSR